MTQARAVIAQAVIDCQGMAPDALRNFGAAALADGPKAVAQLLAALPTSSSLEEGVGSAGLLCQPSLYVEMAVLLQDIAPVLALADRAVVEADAALAARLTKRVTTMARALLGNASGPGEGDPILELIRGFA
jgi:hypothetical protein